MQTHTVETEDGYILTLHRLWNAQARKPNAKVVFLQHGLFSSSDWWVVTAEDSLAFQLANQGYDVWMGNNRGTKYSRKHRSLDADNKRHKAQYFDYSFFELGKFDVPAQIDYVLKSTGKQKLSYMGHSQGTSQMFTALTYDFGGVRSKVDSFVALAPVINVGHASNSMIKNMAGHKETILRNAVKTNTY